MTAAAQETVDCGRNLRLFFLDFGGHSV